MKYMICPQCETASFYVKNDKGERLNVKITRDMEIISTDCSKRIDGFNLNILFCLGCSWSGRINELKKY